MSREKLEAASDASFAMRVARDAAEDTASSARLEKLESHAIFFIPFLSLVALFIFLCLLRNRNREVGLPPGTNRPKLTKVEPAF